MALSQITKLRNLYLKQAEAIALELEKHKEPAFIKDQTELEKLKMFYYALRL
jgi:hypothetical protein